MLRTLQRVPKVWHKAAIRQYSEKSPLQIAFSLSDEDDEDKRYRTEKNPVIPNVENLGERWEKMDNGAQDDIIAYLEDKSRGDWHLFTPDERRAMWWIYFGPWGVRAPGADKVGQGYVVYGGLIGAITAGLIGYKFFGMEQTMVTQQESL